MYGLFFFVSFTCRLTVHTGQGKLWSVLVGIFCLTPTADSAASGTFAGKYRVSPRSENPLFCGWTAVSDAETFSAKFLRLCREPSVKFNAAFLETSAKMPKRNSGSQKRQKMVDTHFAKTPKTERKHELARQSSMIPFPGKGPEDGHRRFRRAR